MILYVPFTRDHAGDLSGGVESWKKNHSANSNLPIHIIYHGDDFDFESASISTIGISEIYICAHSYADESTLALCNHSNILKADIITMSEIAERFNQDFIFISHQISAVHLYCCGSYKKNKEMAYEFSSQLLRPVMPIYHYSGSLTIADNNGQLWSIGVTNVTPLRYVANRISPVDFSEEPRHRVSFKESSQLIDPEEIREKKRNTFFSHIKNARQAIIESKRADTALNL